MRRIVSAVRSLGDRIPSLLRALVTLVPDVALVTGYLGIAYWISLYDSRLAIGWLVGVLFAAGLAANAVEFARRARAK